MRKLLTVAAAVVAATFLAGPVLASKQVNGVMTVDDKAGAFTTDGVKRAESKFEGTEFKARTHLTVVTAKEIPANRKAEFDNINARPQAEKNQARSKFFGDWAREMAKDRKETGIFVLAFVTDRNYFVTVVTDKESDVHRSFTDRDATDARSKLVSGFEPALKQTGPEAQASRDTGLMSLTNYVIDQLKDTTVPEPTGKKADAKNNAQGGGGGGLSILQWVLIIGGGLLVMWIVIGIIRALTGGGGGGGGMNGGGMGGGGGGGFFSGLMGGMFGAMAGMYLYNSMFGSSMTDASASTGGDAYGGDGGAADTGAGNFDGGAEAGGGGGDWGGGGDAGAGGDWGGDAGGGGGDFGGGGDW